MAMLSHNNFLSTIKGLYDRRVRTNMEVETSHRHASFLPMAHLYERINLMFNFLNGSQIACCPVPERIFEYYPIVKPTVISMVPRILNKVYDTIMSEVKKSKIKRFLITQALYFEKPSAFSRVIFRKVKNLFGGEAIIMVTGSAPITRDVLHFFRIALDIPIVEAYGQTESSAVGTTTHVNDLTCGKVGAPGAIAEIKLIDVPNTNYRSNNNQGEICVRGPCVFKGNQTRSNVHIVCLFTFFQIQAIMVMKKKLERQLMKAVGFIPVMLANGLLMVHYVLSIVRSIFSN